VNGKEDMRGQRHSGEGLFLKFGARNHFEIRDCIFYLVFFWSRVWVDCYRGSSFAGSFGLGGQESSWNPRAREMDRLCS
jgi:hypothetical protein